MKSLKITVLFISILLIQACVTTRAQWNESRRQGEGEVVGSSEKTNSSSADPDGLTPAPVASEYGMEEMRAELAKLSGKVEEMEQEKKTLQTTQAEEQQKLIERIAELEAQLKEKEEQKGPAVPQGKTAIEAAKDAIANSNFQDAVNYLDDFLKDHVEGKDAEEGTYLRGESYFKLKDFKKAIVDFSKFPEKFSKSNLHSKALLKIAESFEALDMKEEAKAFYQDLFDKFPKTLEGKIAKKKLSGKSAKK